MKLLWAALSDLSEIYRDTAAQMTVDESLPPIVARVLLALRSARRFLERYPSRPLSVQPFLRSGEVPKSETFELMWGHINGYLGVPSSGKKRQVVGDVPGGIRQTLAFSPIKHREAQVARIIEPDDESPEVILEITSREKYTRGGDFFPHVLYTLLPPEIVVELEADYDGSWQPRNPLVTAILEEKLMDKSIRQILRIACVLRREPLVPSAETCIERIDYKEIAQAMLEAEQALREADYDEEEDYCYDYDDE